MCRLRIEAVVRMCRKNCVKKGQCGREETCKQWFAAVVIPYMVILFCKPSFEQTMYVFESAEHIQGQIIKGIALTVPLIMSYLLY